jgi:hypothetical protein
MFTERHMTMTNRSTARLYLGNFVFELQDIQLKQLVDRTSYFHDDRVYAIPTRQTIEFKVSCHSDYEVDYLQGLALTSPSTKAEVGFRTDFPGQTLIGKLRVRSVGVGAPIDGVNYASVTADVIGKTLIKPNAQEAITMRDVIKINPADVKANKFYVGSKSTLARAWGHPDLKAALEHGKEMVEVGGDDQFIVKIVKVVRRKPQPIVVEDVK